MVKWTSCARETDWFSWSACPFLSLSLCLQLVSKLCHGYGFINNAKDNVDMCEEFHSYVISLLLFLEQQTLGLVVNRPICTSLFFLTLIIVYSGTSQTVIWCLCYLVFTREHFSFTFISKCPVQREIGSVFGNKDSKIRTIGGTALIYATLSSIWKFLFFFCSFFNQLRLRSRNVFERLEWRRCLPFPEAIAGNMNTVKVFFEKNENKIDK